MNNIKRIVSQQENSKSVYSKGHGLRCCKLYLLYIRLRFLSQAEIGAIMADVKEILTEMLYSKYYILFYYRREASTARNKINFKPIIPHNRGNLCIIFFKACGIYLFAINFLVEWLTSKDVEHLDD